MINFLSFLFFITEYWCMSVSYRIKYLIRRNSKYIWIWYEYIPIYLRLLRTWWQKYLYTWWYTSSIDHSRQNSLYLVRGQILWREFLVLSRLMLCYPLLPQNKHLASIKGCKTFWEVLRNYFCKILHLWCKGYFVAVGTSMLLDCSFVKNIF